MRDAGESLRSYDDITLICLPEIALYLAKTTETAY